MRAHSSIVAPRLLNKILVSGPTAGRIVEVEAYGGDDDPASHAFRGPTPRTRSMFAAPGTLYVYLVYGMHFCANVVAHEDGHGGAVLVRALCPLEGLDRMRERRGVDREGALTSGPGKLAQALALTTTDDGTDLTDASSRVRLIDDGTKPPSHPVVTLRIGISRNSEVAWRWTVPEDPNVSIGRLGGYSRGQ